MSLNLSIWALSICLAVFFVLVMIAMFLSVKKIQEEIKTTQKEHDEKLISEIVKRIKE